MPANISKEKTAYIYYTWGTIMVKNIHALGIIECFRTLGLSLLHTVDPE